MSKISLVMIFLLLGFGAYAQNSKSDKKAEKQARKEAKLQQAKENTAALIAVVESKQFVLQANTLFDRYGNSLPLNSNLNFVGFDGEYSTIQLSFTGLVGWNGVGGVTIDGRITKMEIKVKDDGIGFTINAAVQNKGGGLTTMFFRVSSDGNARVDMNGNFGERLSFQGFIVPLQESTVYKGTPRY